MLRWVFALSALVASSQLYADDYSTAAPIGGDWRYAPTSVGSEAIFSNPTGATQLWVQCARATRRISLARPASVAAPFLVIWSSSAQRNLPSAFNPATGRLTAELGAYDPLLDALTASRGRIAVGVVGQPALVLPPWPEIARVVEDCRV